MQSVVQSPAAASSCGVTGIGNMIMTMMMVSRALAEMLAVLNLYAHTDNCGSLIKPMLPNVRHGLCLVFTAKCKPFMRMPYFSGLLSLLILAEHGRGYCNLRKHHSFLLQISVQRSLV